MISDPIVRNLERSAACSRTDLWDLGSVMIALGATIVARSKDGEREIAAAELAEGPFQSAPADGAAHGDPCSRPTIEIGRHLPEDGAQGRRLRHRRGGDLPDPRERLDRERRDRAHVRRSHEPAR